MLNALDIFLLLIFSFFIVSGYSRGFVAQLVDLAGFFIALYLAYTVGGHFALYLMEVFEFVPEAFFPENSLLGYFLINLAGFLLVYFLVRFAFLVLGKVLKVATNLPVIGTLNGLGGALVGALKGLLLLIILVSIGSFIPNEFFQDLIGNSVLSALAFSYIPVMVDFIKEIITVDPPLTV